MRKYFHFFLLQTVFICFTSIMVNGQDCIFDSETPTITCPEDVTEDNDAGQLGAQLIIAVPMGTDNCPGSILTNDFNGTDDASGFYPIGTTTVNWTLTEGGLPDVAILSASDRPNWEAEVLAQLSSSGAFNSVTPIDVEAVTPSLATLQLYDAVLVWTDENFADENALGDVLADYVDGGGGVVVNTFAFVTDNSTNQADIGIQGDFRANGYMPLDGDESLFSSDTPLTMDILDGGHPIMTGVATFDGGDESWFNTNLSVDNGGTLLANWSNGEPLIAYNTPTNGRVVGLNFFPPSSNNPDRPQFWQSNTDGTLIMANALTWAGELNNTATCSMDVIVNDSGVDCEDWVMYLNNNLGGVTDIYSADISSGDAELTYVTTVDYQGHIAYNPDNNLIYVINNMNASYVTVNPHTVVPEVSAPVFLDMDIASVTTAAFAPNGKLLLGTMTEDVIYSVDLAPAVPMVSEFDAFAPINGGDIAFDSAGMLYLATRAGNGFYEVYPEDVLADQLIGTIPSLVTGMALTGSEQMIMSHKANSDLRLRNLNGSDAEVSYPLMLDGEAYAHADGDMTSGCNTWQQPVIAECTTFSTFYADINRPGVSGTDLYSIVYTAEGNADMTFLTNVDFNAHIAYNAEDNIIYLLNVNGSFIRTYNPTSGIFGGDLPILEGPSGTPAAVYNPADGLLYIGSGGEDAIYAVDLGTGMATYVAEAPVHGGDLALQNGSLYLATYTDSKLYEIAGGVAVEVGTIPEQVNGMAQANNETELVMANRDAGVFTKVLAADGSTVGSYIPMIDGEAVTLYDGDMAAGCTDDDGSENEENSALEAADMSTVGSFPNPTIGLSQVVFVTAKTGRTLLEVYDMNGRNVSTLFNQEAQAGLEYRLDFNGSNLPNGVYIYKMTTKSETIINKFVIAK